MRTGHRARRGPEKLSRDTADYTLHVVSRGVPSMMLMISEIVRIASDSNKDTFGSRLELGLDVELALGPNRRIDGSEIWLFVCCRQTSAPHGWIGTQTSDIQYTTCLHCCWGSLHPRDVMGPFYDRTPVW